MFSLAPSWIKVSKSADTVFFSTKLLSSPLVSLCFDNKNVMKNKHIPLKKAASCNRDGWGGRCLKSHLKGLGREPSFLLGDYRKLRCSTELSLVVFTHFYKSVPNQYTSGSTNKCYLVFAAFIYSQFPSSRVLLTLS